MFNAYADPDFLSERGGGGVQAHWRENSLDFFHVFLVFFSPKFSGDAGRGPTIYEGVQMLISIEFDRTLIYQGWGPDPLPPPSLSGSVHA